jgi:hypothetical protein
VLRQFGALVLFLAVVLCSPVSLLAEQWVEVRSSHFTVLSDAGEKQARQIAGEFERMRGAFQSLAPTAPADPSEPVVVTPSGASPTAGVITDASTTSRQVQLALKLLW